MAIKTLVFVVDDIDADLLESKTNFRTPNLLANRVAVRNLGPKPKGYHVDHIDDDWTNNRRSNLRYIPAQENLRKNSRNMRRKSNYIGVYKVQIQRKFKTYEYISARIKTNGKQIYLGKYTDEISAAKAYDLYVITNGLDRPLNFPDEFS